MDINLYITAWREIEPRPYRAHLLALTVLANADAAGVYVPPTAVGLRRDLAHRGQTDGECRPQEVVTAIQHAMAQGLLREDSSESALVLTGASAPYITDNIEESI